METIEVSGRKLYDPEVVYRGSTMPVAVYLVKNKKGKVFNLCICFEGTPIETRLAIDITEKGWVDIYDGQSDLAEAIGEQIMNKIGQHPRLN